MIYAGGMLLKCSDEVVGALGISGGTGKRTKRKGPRPPSGRFKTSGMRGALMNEQSRRLAQNFALAGGGN